MRVRILCCMVVAASHLTAGGVIPSSAPLVPTTTLQQWKSAEQALNQSQRSERIALREQGASNAQHDNLWNKHAREQEALRNTWSQKLATSDKAMQKNPARFMTQEHAAQQQQMARQHAREQHWAQEDPRFLSSETPTQLSAMQKDEVAGLSRAQAAEREKMTTHGHTKPSTTSPRPQSHIVALSDVQRWNAHERHNAKKQGASEAALQALHGRHRQQEERLQALHAEKKHLAQQQATLTVTQTPPPAQRKRPAPMPPPGTDASAQHAHTAMVSELKSTLDSRKSGETPPKQTALPYPAVDPHAEVPTPATPTYTSYGYGAPQPTRAWADSSPPPQKKRKRYDPRRLFGR
jgi:hypothetical protein